MARKFIYDGRDHGDPYPELTPDEVRQAMTPFYPELSNSEIKESKSGDDTVYAFSRRVGTKG